MKRYPRRSQLLITCRRPKNSGKLHITIKLQHHFKYVLYFDVAMPPEAHEMIEEQVEWLKPATMVSKVQSSYPQVTAAQVHTAWRELSKVHWLRDKEQIPSASKLLNEFGHNVDIFEPSNIPEGVEMVAWGMKRIGCLLKGRILEIGLDATCESELYQVSIN